MAERKKGKRSSSPEPLPLFDCIFCVGIHEHLVTQTVKERSLRDQYGGAKRKQNLNATVVEEDTFYEDCKELD